ncbi:type III-B CRISPR module RAMP protein Cmr4 [Thermoanaerobacterium thermosaccharolyticum]|uniref:type III-B CRISPR module RAMP protein Cmr4 n=1 Tax=Thermoanaerobacterium thermosaccharolyticum TaxID=1517 RepID=UPI003DA87E8C
MFKKAVPLFLFCQSPLHAGTGNDLGIVDSPIQRERHTGFPKIEASSLKGSIRSLFEEVESDKMTLYLTFGPENSESQYSSSLGFSDSRILLFPVKSMKGVYGWITCPKVLDRFKNDLNLCGINDIPAIPNEDTIIENNCDLMIKGKSDKRVVVIEEYTIDVKENVDTEKFINWLVDVILPNCDDFTYIKNKMKRDIVILSDDEFTEFVNMSTEVITRTRINNDTGTVDSGALFTEEYLPSETVLYSLIFASPIFNSDKKQFKEDENKRDYDKILEYFINKLPKTIQVGGNSTLGKGIVTTKVYREDK